MSGINYLKPYTYRMLRKEFPEQIKEKLWGDSLFMAFIYGQQGISGKSRNKPVIIS